MSTLRVDSLEEYNTNNGINLNSTLSIKNSKDVIQTLTSSSGALSINVANGRVGTVTLTENITDIDFTNIPTSGMSKFTLRVTQNASTAYTLNLKKITVNGGSEAIGKTIGGLDFSMSTSLSAEDTITFTFINAGTPFIETGNNITEIAQLEDSGNLLFNLDFNNTACYNGSGSTVSDLSSNNFDFTIIGSPTFTTDGDGDKHFTGFSTSNYVQSSSNAGITTNTEPLTVTALVSESSTNNYAGIVGYNYNQANSSMGLISYGGKFGTDQWQPSGWYAAAHSLNTKYLVTWVFPTLADRSTTSGKIYFSATEQSKTLYGTASPSAPSNSTFRFGIWDPSRTDMIFNGKIYAVAVWNSALTAQQVSDNHSNYYSARFTY